MKPSWEQRRFWALAHRQLDRPAEGSPMRYVHLWMAEIFLAMDPIPRFRPLPVDAFEGFARDVADMRARLGLP